VLGGVLCMTLVPAVAARRAGVALIPRWHVDDGIAASLRDAVWASLVVVPAQLFLLGSLIVAGRVAGGVVACQIAFTLFLLPHALLGHPLATVLYPRVARAWADSDAASVRRDADRGLRVLLLLTAPAAALLVALATPATRIIAVGALAHHAGPVVVASALAGYGIGLTAYSWSLFVTRVSYATGDVRTPGVAALVGGVVGGALLLLAARHTGTALLYRVGLAHSFMVVTATVGVVIVLVRRRVVDVLVSQWMGVGIAAVACGVAARVVADRFDSSARSGAVVAVVLGAAVGLVAFVVVARVSGNRVGDLRTELA
jgi:putative peptidoglycan lipid II flippase